MATLAEHPDVFTAVADSRRREILDLLAQGERPVNDVVQALGVRQPQVSKHLKVLRDVGLVNVREAGRLRLYSLRGQPLRPLYDWVKNYERFWDHQLNRIKQRAERHAANHPPDKPSSPSRQE